MIKYNNLYKYCCFGLGQHAQAAEIGGKGSHERAIDITFPSRSQNGIKHKYEIFIVFLIILFLLEWKILILPLIFDTFEIYYSSDILV